MSDNLNPNGQEPSETENQPDGLPPNGGTGGGRKIVAVIAIVAALALIAFLIFLRQQDVQELPVPTPLPTPTPEITATPGTETPPVTEAAPSAEPEPTEIPEPTPRADLDKSIEDVWTLIDQSLAAANQYYGKYHEGSQFVTKNGFLFEQTADMYVEMDDLVDVTDLEPALAEEGVGLMYLNAADLKQYSELSIKDSEGLEIFAVYETKDGYAISSRNSAGGLLSKTDYEFVLSLYKTDHGKIRRYGIDSNEFAAGVAALRQYTEWDGGFDVRYLAGDDKYMSCVASMKGKPQEVREYLLQSINGVWTVKAAGIETQAQKFTYINSHAPDANLALSPKYNLANDLKFVKTDFSAIVDAMRSAAMVYEEDGEPTFATGDDEFVYMEFKDNIRFLCHYDEEKQTWMIYPVMDYLHGESMMKEYSKFKNPPYFYLKQF